ncbi:NAD(P)/FAD-dependent oxidoreductase [Halopelagius fulvigenes]|uniref:NAD(P)/FAD-dependent oxidoreductase n=1 Tax=Halopelagius fulvigenes TaxID=1198324 RepID=A0ABD5TWN0_9EURY
MNGIGGSGDPFLDRLDRETVRAARERAGRAVVVGGAMAGLAAAHALSGLGWDVTLHERQRYEEKRVNCGEAMTDASSIPLPKTPEYGFANRPPEFEVRVYTGDTAGRTLAGRGVFPSRDGYVTDRNVVERRWAERVADAGVDVRDGAGVTKAAFRAFSEEYDLVVDATGQPSLTSKAERRTGEYAGRMTALNADVEGDFSELYPRAHILFENYLGYSWAFPKSETRANVGIGWAEGTLPKNYYEAFVAACERNGWPVPDRSATNVYTIPRGPSLDHSRTWDPRRRVARVGDAAGIANRFTGKGISQAVESSYLLARLVAEERIGDYPGELYRRMRDEYRLAYVVRGALEDGRPDILGGVMDAVSGIDVEDVDREPRYAVSRLLRRPVLLAKLAANRTMRSRLVDAYTDDWEYRRVAGSS